ncbi:MAG: sulfatase [Pirellulales bacterium]|nr:sulfatase [Pirellulales bacterium]
MHNRHVFLFWAGLSITLCLFGDSFGAPGPNPKKPNILWIIVEDMSCDFGYQRQNLVSTPNVDWLAREGQVFTNAYVTAPVCSPCRSALITGMYQTAIGAHNHRTSRGTVKYRLPSKIKLIPELFQEAGYYTCNCGNSRKKGVDFKRYGKTDYNFEFDMKSIYDGPDWSGRQKDQPFFAQVQLRGGKLRNVPRWYEEIKAGLENLVTVDQVTLPPYYPDDPAFREDWAQYLNTVQYTDKEVGIILDRLKSDGLLDNTIIFFITDHGISQARGKQFLYDEGAKIPFIVWFPKHIKAGTVRDELIVHIDMAATSLYFAGIDIPDYMQGRSLFGPQAKPREYIVCARDRCDETVDRIRSVRKGNFKYIRNFYPKRPYLQPCAYKDHKPFIGRLRQLHAENKLNEVQSLHLSKTRPEEELYDLGSDRWEVHNLADKPEYRQKLREIRCILANWILKSNDQGRFDEPDAMYDSDMNAYIQGQKKAGQTAYAQEVERNVKIMKQWKSEGK